MPSPQPSEAAVEAVLNRRRKANAPALVQPGETERDGVLADLQAAYPALRAQVLEEVREGLRETLETLSHEPECPQLVEPCSPCKCGLVRWRQPILAALDQDVGKLRAAEADLAEANRALAQATKDHETALEDRDQARQQVLAEVREYAATRRDECSEGAERFRGDREQRISHIAEARAFGSVVNLLAALATPTHAPSQPDTPSVGDQSGDSPEKPCEWCGGTGNDPTDQACVAQADPTETQPVGPCDRCDGTGRRTYGGFDEYEEDCPDCKPEEGERG